MKLILIILTLGFLSGRCVGQIKNSTGRKALEKTVFISLYEMDRTSEVCLDQKNPPLFDNSNKINTCFLFKKKLSKQFTKKVIEILLNERNFERPDENCFTSDYGMILFDDRKHMIGSITMSLVCNNISLNNRLPIKLTNDNKRRLLEIVQ